jgi:drug/metabolite transporter (DMT)-like permease
VHQALKSIFWKILSCGCFACINIIVRYLTGGSPIEITLALPVYTIMFYQYLVGSLISVPWLYLQKRPTLTTEYPMLNFARVALAAISIGLYYFSLRFIPTTEVVALGFIGPIITIIAAIIILKEKLTHRRLIALGLSLVGGFFMLRPDKSLGTIGQYGIYVLLPIIAAILFAFDKILVRKLLSLGQTPELLAIYLLTFIAPICLIPAIHNGWIWPNTEHVIWLSLLGVLCALANFSFNKAYELAEVTFLMPFGVAKILISGLLSYLAFAEFPSSLDMWIGISIIGISMIILSRSKTHTK